MASGSIINQLEPLIELTLPENIVYENERLYMGNLSYTLDRMHNPSKGYRKMNPIEYGYASTKDLPNSSFIILQRYPLLPYWNRYYSHPYIENLSKFLYEKDGSHHVYKIYNNTIAHMIVEDSATSENGYKLAHSVVSFTY